jgi:eukaryotic-like serine/threonine-protein kinase
MMAESLLAGRYELRARIGVGGYGEVWRGVDSVLARPVAIKLLQDEHTVQPEAMMRFRAEARHAGALSHPCIAHVYDYCEPSPPDPPFLVMELVDGLSLAELLTRGPLDVARAMDVIGQAAAGLHAAHQAGLVHRDIKPGNLLISRTGPVKITDFGIAQPQVPAVSGPVTMTGMVLGTAGYMAPERIEGNLATVASDLYALGVVAYECLAGLVPRGGLAPRTSDVTRTGDVTAGQPAIAPRSQPLPPLPAGIPADVAALVSRLTARDPARRPATAGEVARQAAALRDRYRDAAPAAGGASAPGRADAGDDTAFDSPAFDNSAFDDLAYDSADHTVPDGAAVGAAAPTERGPAVPVAATGPDPRSGGRPAGAGAGGRRPRRSVLAIAAAGLTGAALLAYGVIEVVHQRGSTVAAVSQSHPTAATTVDLREASLVGRPLGEVRRELLRDGLIVRVKLEVSPLPAGQVLRVLPSGVVRKGSAVFIVAAVNVAITSVSPVTGQLPPPGQRISTPVKPTAPASVSSSASVSPPASPTTSTSPPDSTSPSPSTSPSDPGSPSPAPS